MKPVALLPSLLFVSIGLLFAFGAACQAQADDQSGSPDAAPFDHGAYDGLLSRFVADGLVDYGGLNDVREELTAYLDALGAADVGALPNREERFAFWLNAYNAFTIEGVLDTLPADASAWTDYSVKDVEGFWDTTTYRAAGADVTLNHIEHEILRKEFGDARLHMAIVCASRGCPPLRDEAYVGEQLDGQLDDQAQEYLASEANLQVDVDARSLKVSSIFEWFKDDFVADAGSVPAFIANHLTDDATAQALREGDWTVEQLDYDWKLNLQ